jgi:uncharacterized protein (DUF58 family)
MRQIETLEQTPLSLQIDGPIENRGGGWAKNPLAAAVRRWLNREMPADRTIDLRISWPLWLLPLLLLNQLFAPHIVWVVLLIALSGFYLVGYLWVRYQTPAIHLSRRRVGSILVAGDLLQEEFELSNRHPLPLLWAEFIDSSTVPDYHVGRIVACEGESSSRWRTEVLCKRRGLYRLGPHTLRFQDPLGLFSVTIESPYEEIVLIYPRVAHLPPVALPHGSSQGGERQRRPILGNMPAATVSDYHPGDSLRHVHWLSSARRGRIMVKDLEIEPSGNIWIVLDLDEKVHVGEGEASTLEQGVVVAASLAAELLSGREQRAVGLLAYGGESGEPNLGGLVHVVPGTGSAHTWSILNALAPVETGELSLAVLLASNRDRIGRRGTVTVITTATSGATPEDMQEDSANGYDASKVDWVAELVHLKSVGVDSSVILIVPDGGETHVGEGIQSVLARMDIPCTLIDAGAPLPALLTFRRRRRVVRATPTGGVVSYEVDEEVG